MIYVLTHEYSDKSGFAICGVTQHPELALAWKNANDENKVYPIPQLDETRGWMNGFPEMEKAK